jgi:enoyl-CoA hydratase
MKYKHFLVSIEDHIATVQFNRPEKANALHRPAWEEMKNLFEELDQNKDVRVIILGGAGKHFCSGIDLELLMSFQQLNQMDCEARKREALKEVIQWLQSCVNAIENCRQPVVAAIHKACIGGGLDIAAACDMRYCSEDAFFSIKEIDLGLVADLGVLQRLPKIISPGMVAEMAYTARNVSSSEARPCGLVNAVFDSKEQLQQEVKNMARSISEKSPLVVRGIKQHLLHSRDHSVGEGLRHVANWNAGMLFSNDILEAFQAQMEKRKPRFND